MLVGANDPVVNSHMMGIEADVRDPLGRTEVFRGIPCAECSAWLRTLTIGTDMHVLPECSSV